MTDDPVQWAGLVITLAGLLFSLSILVWILLDHLLNPPPKD